MKAESIAFAVSGTFLGLLVGWVIGSQQAAPAAPATAPVAAQTSPAPAPASPPPAPVDSARVAQLEQQAASQPSNEAVRVELGNLYFDAQQYDKAIPWYEQAFKLNPKDVNVSTDLGVAYYYTNQVDRSLAQLDRSLALDPRHLKTLLNQGIVRAFGKQDLTGATQSWERVVSIAPDSEEGKAAQQGLDGIKAARGGSNGSAAPGGN